MLRERERYPGILWTMSAEFGLSLANLAYTGVNLLSWQICWWIIKSALDDVCLFVPLCFSVCVSDCLSVSLSACISRSLYLRSVCLSIQFSIFPWTNQPVNKGTICPFACLSVCPPACLPTCLSISLPSVCLSVCLYLFMYVWLHMPDCRR